MSRIRWAIHWNVNANNAFVRIEVNRFQATVHKLDVQTGTSLPRQLATATVGAFIFVLKRINFAFIVLAVTADAFVTGRVKVHVARLTKISITIPESITSAQGTECWTSSRFLAAAFTKIISKPE
jgi:hypothetical protein